jgi:O-antigen ligase
MGEFSILAKKLELRWLFLLFPVVLFLQRDYFDLKKWYSILSFYILGISSFMTFSIVIFILKISAYQSFFLSKDLLLTMSHIPSIYYAMFLNFALMSCIYLRKSEIHLLRNQWVQFIFSLFVGISMLLIQSKIGFAVMMLIHIVAAIIQWTQYRNFPKTLYAFMFFSVFFFIQFFDFNKLDSNYIFSSSVEVSKRVSAWQQAFSIIKTDYLFGNPNYNGVIIESGTRTNAHNQWLDLLLEMGILGVLALFGVYIFSFYMAFRSRDYFFKGFLLLTLIFSLVESTLANQSGIVFFSIFNSLFLLKSRLRVKTNEIIIKKIE